MIDAPFVAAAAAWNGLPGRPSVTARIQGRVAGRARGSEKVVTIELVDGEVTSVQPAVAEAPDVVLALNIEDAQLMLAGELEPNVAFMQGRLKVNGSMGVVLQLLPIARTPEFAASLSTL